MRLEVREIADHDLELVFRGGREEHQAATV